VSSVANLPIMSDAFEKMDRMYHLQRHFYDFTRKYYLLGRDLLLDELDVQPGETVLEVGCGTGRNLVILAKRYPGAHFFGLDASADMLEMADVKVDSARLNNVTLANELAEDFYYVNTFEMTDRFDKIFFSYSISMIPAWREAIENSLNNLRPGGELFIVDFYDQKDLPRTFRKMLQNWLKAFHVQFWNDLLPYLGTLETKGLIRLNITPLYKRYAFMARLEKV
jgi:S-adenosylmethionine-diacylgycerolhomoserine-N-methlytransferase